MRNSWRTLGATLAVSLMACGGRGDAGGGFNVSDAQIAVWDGYQGERCTYVVVLDWPLTATAEERTKDDRLTIGSGGVHLIRGSAGRINPWQEPPQAYVFRGENLTIFPIRMTEDQVDALTAERTGSYAAVVAYLRTFEVK